MGAISARTRVLICYIMTWLHRRSRRQQLFLFALLVLLLLGGVFAHWVLHDLPSLDQLQAGMALPSTRIYDRHRHLLYEILPAEQGRNWALDLSQMPQHCLNAVIAIEDANYYHHPGIDPIGILRALWINLQGGEILAGGSTITQQTARLLLLETPTRSLRRKLRELVLALQLQSRFSKDEILALYLNQAYFGNLAYGIDAASQAYFQKDAPDLSLAECALLAGILQNAIHNDPLTQLPRAKARQAVALRLMQQNGFISEAEAQAALADELQFAAAVFPIETPHFVMEVWRILERDYAEALHRGGLQVITTVDLNWTNHAREIVRQQLAALNNPADGAPPANANNAALLALDPLTGEVLTMLGSPDYFDEAIDGAVNAILAYRQPGSALKPFTYAEAMNTAYSNPYTAATMLLDVRTPFITNKLESYVPANYGQLEHGPVLLREALASSYNIPAVIALEHIGLERLVQFLSALGLSNLQDNAQVDLSITLGGGEVRLLDLAEAYSAFANGGYDIEPQYILSITDAAGQEIYQYQPPPLQRRLIDERIAFIISDILSDNEARIPSFGLNSPLNLGFPAAAKTGTTTDFRDNWVLGYTPDLVVGVWVGNADNSPMRDVSGISGAGPIYNLFMRTVKRGTQTLDFAEPPGLLRLEVCRLSGLLPTEYCRRRINEIFIPGTEPRAYDPFHQPFIIDRETGWLADGNTQPENRLQRIYLVLPIEAHRWARNNGIPQPPLTPTNLTAENDDGLRLLSPDPYTIFQLSEQVPLSTQRLRFTVATPATTRAIQFHLNDELIGTAEAPPWEFWWTLQIGQYNLLASATLDDGTGIHSEAIPFSVVEHNPLAAFEDRR